MHARSTTKRRGAPVQDVVAQLAAAVRAAPPGLLEADRVELKVAHELGAAVRAALGEAVAVELSELAARDAAAEVQAAARVFGGLACAFLEG